MTTPEAPLAALLVVDLSRHLPGPLAARMLANLGARVIKIERPGEGDPLRRTPPFRRGRSVLAEALLSGVESVTLDLERRQDRAVLEALLAEADVLVETFRPTTLARFGLAPEELTRRLPRLVGCSISGWGANGPRARRAGHDLTYQAAAGALAATGRVTNLPTADLLGAWSAVAAISAALYGRERSGKGCWIDASLFDAAVVGNVTNLTSSVKRAPGAAGPGLLTGALPCYRLYETKDGRLFALAALEDKFWRTFCDAVERPGLVRRQYSTDAKTHRQVAEVIASRTADEWQTLCSELDLPAELVATPREALADDQTVARGLDGVMTRGLPFPAVLSGGRPRGGERVPRLGEHTAAVVDEFCPVQRRDT